MFIKPTTKCRRHLTGSPYLNLLNRVHCGIYYPRSSIYEPLIRVRVKKHPRKRKHQ